MGNTVITWNKETFTIMIKSDNRKSFGSMLKMIRALKRATETDEAFIYISNDKRK